MIFKVKVLLTSIPDDVCPRNRGTSGFGVSRRGCGGHHRVQYQSTSDGIVIDVISLSRVAQDDGRRVKEAHDKDSISINRMRW